MYLSSNHLCVHLTTIHLSVYLPSYLSIHLLSLLCSRSAMSDSATPWTVACQTPLSMGFSRHESWSGSPWPPPGDLPDPGIKPSSPASPALAGGFLTTEPSMHNRNRLTGIEKTRGCQGVRRRGRTDGKFGISRCKVLYREQKNNRVLLYSPGSYIQYPVI